MGFSLKMPDIQLGKAKGKKASKKKGDEEGINERFAKGWAKFSFNARVRSKMYKDLAAYGEAGLPIYQALKAIEDVYKRRKNPLLPMISEWVERNEAGEKFASILSKWVPAEEVGLIAGGEMTGNLVGALKQASELTRRRADLKKLLKSKLVMPALLVVALFGFIYYISIMIVPTAKGLLPPDMVPALAAAYFAFCEFIIDYGLFIAAATIGLVTLIFATLPRWQSKMRSKLDKVFPWTFYRSTQAGFLLITMSAMLRAGMTMNTILDELIRHAAPYTSGHLKKTRKLLERGHKESAALDTGLLLPDMNDRLYIYSKLPDFSKVMHEMGSDSIEAMEESVNRVASVTSVVTMALLALFIIATIFALGEASMAVSDAVQQKGGV